MTNKLISKLEENIFLVSALLWALLWMFPWAMWLEPLPWVRTGIGIIIFAVPGMTVSMILAGKRITLPGHFTSGVAISVFIVGALGFLGRVFHLPFEYIKPIFALAGLIGLIVLVKRPLSELYKPKSFSIVTSILFIGVALFSVITSLGNAFGGDDLSYLAYLTNWQHANPLNFHEIIFGLGGLDHIRFWFAMFPMNLAFLAEITNLPGLLLLGIYLEPFLVAAALLSLYNLYEDLLPSGYLPIAALLFHFTFYFMLYGTRQPGSTFFNRMSEDKVFAAFILAPAFFLAIRYLLEDFSLKSAFFALCVGFSLTFTHPIILTYSIIIAGLYASFLTIIQKNLKKLVVVIILLMMIILPVALLRFIEVPLVRQHIFGMEAAVRLPGAFYSETAADKPDAKTILSFIEGTPFYGFNLERVKIPENNTNEGRPWQMFLSWSYLWILGLSLLWSLFNITKNNSAVFLGATSLFVLIAAIPYTGWLLGYLVSARMLWRTPWMFPIGMAGVILTKEFLDFISRQSNFQKKHQSLIEPVTLGLTFLVSLVLIYSFSANFYIQKWERLATLDDQKSKFQMLAALGNYLETNIEENSIFVAPREFSDYLPGISSKSKVVFFRTNAFTPHEVNTKKLDLLFSQDIAVSIQQRMNTLKRYHVRYILVQNSLLKDYYAAYPEYFSIRSVDGFWLIEFREASG